MEEKNSLQEIRKNYTSFSGVERKIADFVLRFPQRTVHMTTKSLAAEAGVSEGSIIHFANRLGFTGFTQLKINLAGHLGEQEAPLFDNLVPADGPKDAVRKMVENAVASFQQTYAAISQTELEHAAKLLMEAKRIDLYGVGSSSMVVTDIYYRLMRIGLPAYAVTDPLIAPVSAMMLDGQCLAVGVSYSGRTVDTLRAVKLAKKQGAKTLCVTNYAKSPLAKLCDSALVVVSQESEINREAVVSRLTQLLLFDSLCAYISYQRKDKSIEYIENVVEILGEQRDFED